MIVHGQALASTRQNPSVALFSGILILVPTIPPTTPIKGGKIPPPKNSSPIERTTRIVARQDRRKKAPAQIIVANPRSMDKMPVFRKFGSIVMAGSQRCQTSSGTHGAPIDAIMMFCGSTSP